MSLLKRASENQIRQIRVFISSTFRDMQLERDLLVKKIFPQLRKMCEERSVVWTEVDLRWGITTEQTAEGKVLPLCLEEIQRCRPYFIGLLGERYGWVPESVPDELVQAQPWLREHLNSSVTELEILHGVFTEVQTHGHAFFYFRDRKYLEGVWEGERNEFEAENPDAAERLVKLKRKIRDVRNSDFCSLRENYSGPEELGEWILEDFTNLVNELYPKEENPDALDQQTAWHEAHARSRQLAFIGREDLIERLNEHARGTGKPLVLVGESGCGKSSLVAEWLSRWRESNSDDLIIQHYIGSASSSADWQGLVRRILGELKRTYKLKDELPKDDDALRVALADWAGKVFGRKRVLLMLDALNQLEDEPTAKQLGWLPDYFPPNFRVVLTSLPGVSHDVLRRREFLEIEVPLFTADEIESAAIAYFRIFSKTPSERMIEDLKSTPAARNPLYLRAVLDELRQFGRYEELQNKTQKYLSARNPAELFDLIIARWDDDFGQHGEYPGIVRDALALIVCSRFGLSEAEILDLLGRNGQPVPHRFWTPFYLAAENALSQNDGLLRVGHEYLQRAVETRLLNNAETKKGYRLAIADYFAKRGTGIRTAAELPWQLRQSFENNRLRHALLDLNLALEILNRPTGELLGYWVWLEEERSIGPLYIDLVRSPTTGLDWTTTTTSKNATIIAEFLTEAGTYPHAEELYQYALQLDEEMGQRNSLNTAIKLIKLSDLLLLRKKSFKGEISLLRAIDILDEQIAEEGPLLVSALLNLAAAQEGTGRLDEAEKHCRRALQIAEDHWGHHDELVAKCLGQLGELLLGDSIRFTEMDRMFRSERKHSSRHTEADPLLRRALAIHKKIKGVDHPEVAYDLHRISICLSRGNQLSEAEQTIRQALSIAEKAFGPYHPYIGILHSTYADILNLRGLEDEASGHRAKSEKIDEEIRNDAGIVDAFDTIMPGISDVYKWVFTSTWLGRLGVRFSRTYLGLTGKPIPIWLNDLAEYQHLDHLLIENKSIWQRITKWLSTGLSFAQLFIHLLVVFYAIKEALIARTFSSVLAVIFTLGMHMAQIWGVIIVDLFWVYQWLPSIFAKCLLVFTIIYATNELFHRISKK